MPATSSSWLKVLKNDKRVIFIAASKAHRCIMDRVEGSGQKDRDMKPSLMGEAVFAASMEQFLIIRHLLRP